MLPQSVDCFVNGSFSPRDYQVELYESARLRNTIACLKSDAGKPFIAVMLIREKASEVCSNGEGRYQSVYLTPTVSLAMKQSAYLRHHTPLKIGIFHGRKGVSEWSRERWLQEIEKCQVLVMTYPVFLSTLQNGYLKMDHLNVLILDECHTVVQNADFKKVLATCDSVRPRILGLTASIVNNKCRPLQLARLIVNLETSLKSVIQTSNSILSALQHSTQPRELICETSSDFQPTELEKQIVDRVQAALSFVRDHRYDPTEYYGDQDYLQEIPDPCTEPLAVLEEFIDIVHSFGPWGADRAALIYLIHLEKLKTRAVYERHYLLLCLVFTTLLEIRVLCEEAFQKYTDLDRIQNFSRPKVLRLMEILRIYRPPPQTRSAMSCSDQTTALPAAVNDEATAVQATLSSDVRDALMPILSASKSSPEEPSSESVCVPRVVGEHVTTVPQPADPSMVALSDEFAPSVQDSVALPSVTGLSEKPPVSLVNFADLVPAQQPLPATGSAQQFGRRRRPDFSFRHQRNRDDTHQLCGLVFAESRTTAKLLYHMLKDASRCDPELAYLSPLYTVGRAKGMNAKEIDSEERKQEDVMKRFRSRDCNVLVATSVLEDGIDVPACDLVIRYDLPQSYRAYVHSKARARAKNAHYILMVEHLERSRFLMDLSQFHAIEQLLLHKSGYVNTPIESRHHAECALQQIQNVYQPGGSSKTCASLINSIAIINRYCAKLPSDCFTRLTPIWDIQIVPEESVASRACNACWSTCETGEPQTEAPKQAYTCSLQLPINSPLRQTIVSLPMPSQALAKRSVALEACRLLHQLKELDENFHPVGKENLRLEEEEDYNADLEEENVPETSPRPGTTKRRQYYYKQVADPFTDCMPRTSEPCFLYAITMLLTEPIPEEQNTRGRKIYKPETSSQSLGILSRKPISQICPFPIFTRSGEVEVDLVKITDAVLIDEEQLERITNFQRYIFKSVLSLEKDPMLFDAGHTDCSYMIVPLRRVADDLHLDFAFIDLISSVRDAKPQFIPDEERAGYVFDPRKFLDTVVMRWYRDQEHPQCFYVAEIFYELNPQSKFPDNNYPTFEKYYRDKYGIQIQNLKQPLLDVDHTSARLNFLTPRYVNRKGVMLPTSSEHTKKTQRESLQQKQILVPELCSIHPFSASLWRQAVCLPCILYRLNGLLLAEKLRCKVAAEISLGKVTLDGDFRWPALRFGWKRKTVLPSTPPAQPLEDGPKEATSAEESSGDKPTDPLSGNSKTTKSGIKAPRRESRPSKSSGGGAMMDIGVWNPDAVQGSSSSGNAEGGDDDYDYNDLQAVALLTNENGADFDWTKPVGDAPGSANGPLPVFNVGTQEGVQAWENSREKFSEFRPRSPSEFVDNYSDYEGSYNSDQSFMDESDSDDLVEEPNDEESCKVKEFGPRLVCKGDTAEAIEEVEVGQMKKKKSPEEEEIEDGQIEDESSYHFIEDLLSLEWDWDTGPSSSLTDLDARCDELLVHHQELLLDKSLVNMNEKIPITPPFMPASTTNGNGDGTTDSNTPQLPTGSMKGGRLASESPYMLEMTRLLLGAYPSQPSDPTTRTAPLSDHASGSLDQSKETKPPEVTPSNDDTSSALEFGFSFDEQPELDDHPGPSPSVILQAFTMSSANDGINLERLETIGDSFLKYAITTYLYCKYSAIHEGKLSYLRSRQVSNLHLYQLGKRKLLGECMVATKFNPHDNWLPPGYVIPDALEEALITSGIPLNYWNVVDLQGMEQMSSDEVKALVQEKTEQILMRFGGKIPSIEELACEGSILVAQDLPRFVPYNLLTQHSIPDKSIADCVEALIGAYLTACGPRGALLFMSWLGLKVLPPQDDGSFGYWSAPVSPMINRPFDADTTLNRMLAGFESFEEKIRYRFNDRYYLLQAFSHASYYSNRLTDCYQRLEFLGDAVLDYLITRYLYEDPRQHPPGALTDLRSALVNNTTFAVLAVRFEFHRYFKHFSHTLNQIMDKFIKAQEENGHCINEEYYLIEEGESEEAEDVEVPKALGDVFESVAGAIYLDSGMSLNAVWRVYYGMMRHEIDEFSKNVPKSPIRELLELETDRVKFGKAERLPDGRVRVTVDVIGKGTFKGIGRNYRIAKCTAAKFALRTLEKRKMLAKRGEQ